VHGLHSAFSPRILIERGDVTGYLALNDGATNSSYLAVMRKLKAQGPAARADPDPLWAKDEWHQVALVFDGMESRLVVDGRAVAAYREADVKQVGDACQFKKDRRCARGSGVAMGEGVNGRLQRVAVYDYALPPARLEAHHAAFFDAAPDLGSGGGAGRRSPGTAASRAQRAAGAAGGTRRGWWPSQQPRLPAASGENGSVGGGERGFAFAACRLPWEERDAGMGSGLVPALMSFIVLAVGLLAILTAAILHLLWSNLGHGGGDLMQGSMSTRAAIPEHSVVLDNPPQYPWLVLGLLGLLLPVAYLSQWYDQVDATTRDGREAYVVEYLLWLGCECGGTGLLLALSNMHDPRGTACIVLLSVSSLTVVLCAAADLGGGVEGASKASLCPREVQGPPPLDLGAGGWGDERGIADTLLWGWGCLPPMGW
jgi:hypothetical protein